MLAALPDTKITQQQSVWPHNAIDLTLCLITNANV